MRDIQKLLVSFFSLNVERCLELRVRLSSRCIVSLSRNVSHVLIKLRFVICLLKNSTLRPKRDSLSVCILTFGVFQFYFWSWALRFLVERIILSSCQPLLSLGPRWISRDTTKFSHWLDSLQPILGRTLFKNFNQLLLIKSIGDCYAY